MVEFRDHSLVELVDYMPREVTAERRVVEAARVSSGTDKRPYSLTANAGLLKMLARDRHGSPFEHVVFTFRIETPIFVAREFFRHRIASYNETSGRYREMSPVFYIPPAERPLIQEGKPGAYTFSGGTADQYEAMREMQESVCEVAWHDYQAQLDLGIAKEVARNVLPLSLFTSFYVTMNLRAYFNFASLRWAHPESETPTFPLWEIEQVAKDMEIHVRRLAPGLINNFTDNGRRPV